MSSSKTSKANPKIPRTPLAPTPPDLANSSAAPLAIPGQSAIATPSQRWALSQPWMIPWIEAASRCLSIVGACDATGVSLLDVHEARKVDPKFNMCCQIYDRVVDLTIIDSVRSSASGGEIRSQMLYFSQVRSLVFKDHTDAMAILPPEDAENVIRVTLRDMGEVVDDPSIFHHAFPPPPAP